MQIPNEKGWVIRGSCERVWFLPYTAVVQDYKNYLMDAGGITSEQADEQIGVKIFLFGSTSSTSGQKSKETVNC